MIHAIFAWAEDRVFIPSIGFGIGDKLADAKHVPLVRSIGTDASTLDPSPHKKILRQ